MRARNGKRGLVKAIHPSQGVTRKLRVVAANLNVEVVLQRDGDGLLQRERPRPPGFGFRLRRRASEDHADKDQPDSFHDGPRVWYSPAFVKYSRRPGGRRIGLHWPPGSSMLFQTDAARRSRSAIARHSLASGTASTTIKSAPASSQ